MYKNAGQNSQTRFNRQRLNDAGAAELRAEAVTGLDPFQHFERTMSELDRQIHLAKGTPRRKELGRIKYELQLRREAQRGIGEGGGKANLFKVSQFFREKIFALLPDDAQRLWDEAVAQEERERLNTVDNS